MQQKVVRLWSYEVVSLTIGVAQGWTHSKQKQADLYIMYCLYKWRAPTNDNLIPINFSLLSYFCIQIAVGIAISLAFLEQLQG